MAQKIKFGDIEVGQRFSLGPAHYIKGNARNMGRPCEHCGERYHNVIRMDKDHGFNHFCDGDIITVPTTTIQVSDDLAMEIFAGHPRYRFLRLASKVGAWATEDTPGFVGVTFEEIPALVRALLDIQPRPCPACVDGCGPGPVHVEGCPEYAPSY